MKHIYQAVGLMLLLSSCSSPYGPLTWRGGYSDRQLSPTRFAVRFEGNGASSPEHVEELFLRRCADVAKTNGYDWFVIEGERASASTSAFTDSEGSYKSTTTLRPDGLGGAVADTKGSYTPPSTTIVTRHSKAGIIVGYKEGTQPKGAYKSTVILDKYKD